jgi:hypothetical protein
MGFYPLFVKYFSKSFGILCNITYKKKLFKYIVGYAEGLDIGNFKWKNKILGKIRNKKEIREYLEKKAINR